MMFGFASSRYRDVVLADLPAAYLPLADKTGTSAANLVGSAGTYPSGVTLANGVLIRNDDDRAVTMAGTGAITIPYSAAFNGSSLSMECWFSWSYNDVGLLHRSTGGGAVNTGFQLFLETTMNSRLITTAGIDDITTAIPDSGIHHAVTTYNGTTHILYLDGVSVASSSPAQPIVTGTDPFIIGAAGPYIPYSGLIGHVALYNYALSATRVMAHYQKGKGQ